MSISINTNHGTINHIENSTVTINAQGKVVTEGKLCPSEEAEVLEVEALSSSEKLESPSDKQRMKVGIRAVFDANICESKSDWAVVVKIMEERKLTQKSAYDYDARCINEICGVVTSADSIARSICMSKIKGTYPNWEIRSGEETRETPNKLNHFKEIAEILIKALDA